MGHLQEGLRGSEEPHGRDGLVWSPIGSELRGVVEGSDERGGVLLTSILSKAPKGGGVGVGDRGLSGGAEHRSCGLHDSAGRRCERSDSFNAGRRLERIERP